MARRIDTDRAAQFLKLQNDLPQIIKMYNVNKSALCKSLDMARSTFYLKMKDQSFTGAEMLQICAFINR